MRDKLDISKRTYPSTMSTEKTQSNAVESCPKYHSQCSISLTCNTSDMTHQVYLSETLALSDCDIYTKDLYHTMK